MKNPESFIDDLFKYDIFYKIVDLISLDRNYLLLIDLFFFENLNHNLDIFL